MTDYITFHIWLHKHSTGFVSENLSAYKYKGTVVSCADNKRYQHSHSRPVPDSTGTSTKSFQKINHLSERAPNVRLQMSRIEKYFILNRKWKVQRRSEVCNRRLMGDPNLLTVDCHQLHISCPPLYR